MRNCLYRGKRTANGEWLYGKVVDDNKDCFMYTFGGFVYTVDPDTVSEFTGLSDKNGNHIFEGNIVRFCGIVGEVVFEKGAFGIGTHETIDYNLIEKEMKTINSHNLPEFCGNDNFISLWEIWWNFEIEDEQLDVVEVIGNKWDGIVNNEQALM